MSINPINSIKGAVALTTNWQNIKSYCAVQHVLPGGVKAYNIEETGKIHGE